MNSTPTNQELDLFDETTRDNLNHEIAVELIEAHEFALLKRLKLLLCYSLIRKPNIKLTLDHLKFIHTHPNKGLGPDKLAELFEPQ